MRRTIWMSVVVLAALVAFASGVMAQQKPAPVQTPATQETKLEKFSGVIEKVDEAAKDVLVQFHKEKLTFSMGDHTKITEANKEVPLTGLKKGMWASVEYKKEGDKLMAETVSVSMPKVMAKKETPSEVQKVNPSEKTP
jgi:Cu/Ag efflux protein CusF